MEEVAIFARRGVYHGMKGAGEVLRIGKSAAFRDLAHRKIFPLEQFTRPPDAEFNDGLLWRDTKDLLIQITETPDA